MNEIDRYYFLLLVNSTNKNQKISLLKSISTSQYKILKEIAFNILNEIIPLDKKQFKKLSKYKTFIRKLGKKKVSGQVLGKNYSIVIDIIRIGLQYYEICTEICSSSKRRVGKNKSSGKKCEAITYSQSRKRDLTSSESSEEFSSEEFSSEETSSEESSGEENCYKKSRCTSSGKEFTKESSSGEEFTKESSDEEETENTNGCESEEDIEEEEENEEKEYV